MTREQARQWLDRLVAHDKVYNTGPKFTGWYVRCLDGRHVFMGRRVQNAIDYLLANQKAVATITGVLP